jgi:hypothetical protein
MRAADGSTFTGFRWQQWQWCARPLTVLLPEVVAKRGTAEADPNGSLLIVPAGSCCRINMRTDFAALKKRLGTAI